MSATMNSVRIKLRRAVWKFLSARLPELTITVDTRHGRLSFSTRDRAIGRELFVKGEFEYDKLQKVIALAVDAGRISVRNQGYVLDVGANIGTVCITLVREGIFSAGLAFEPEPRNYRLLVKNVCRNGLSRAILAFDCALSSTPGHVEMELSPRNFGDYRIRLPGEARHAALFGEPGWSTIRVRGHRLDDFLKTLPLKAEEIKLLWLDVQGHETHVLEGADATLGTGAPVVVEFWPYGLARAGVSPERFYDCVSARFRWFYDLAEASPPRRAVAEIERMFARYTGTRFSDLLLLAG